ncbi:IS701 family transposase [Streptomyces angustmyceticus]
MVGVDEAGLWAAGLESVVARMAGRFSRVDLRWRMRDYVRGLLAPVERKNGWQLAEYAGHRGPAGFQHLLNGASWDADALRDDVQQYVADQLGCPDGVLAVDDIGFLKKSTTSAGVQRQYSGAAGRTENCQIGVFATYATAKGRTLVDRDLYLPKSWRGDTDRCRAAGIPDNHGFATKGELARAIFLRALASSLPIAWVTGDCAYGQEWRMRRTLEEAGVGRRNVPGIGATEHQKPAPCPQQPPPPGRASRSPPMPAAAKSPSTSTTTLRHTPPSALASICASSPTASASTPASTARSRLRWGPFAKSYRENDTSEDTARRVARQHLSAAQNGIAQGRIAYDWGRKGEHKGQLVPDESLPAGLTARRTAGPAATAR